MSSYNSYRGSLRRFRAADERTPLLPNDGACNNHVRNRDNDDDDVRTISDVLDVEGGAFTVLSRVPSIIPLGIEAEAVPGTANTPDEYGDFKLPSIDELRVKIREGDAEALDSKGSLKLKGGISWNQFWLIFTSIMIANFAGAFDSTIMASTHTMVTSAFHASELASWLSTSFLLTSTTFQPLFGRVSDVTGRRLPFVLSAGIFTLGTVWCALAQSIGSFIAARALCGLSAGGMLTMGSIILSDMLPLEIRGRYQSINNIAWGTGSALGAASGGWLADTLGWRWEFGIQVPFLLFCTIVGAVTIPSTAQKKAHMRLVDRFADFDWAGSFYLTISIACLVLGLSLGGNVLPWSDTRVIITLVMAVIFGNLLIRTERNAKSAVMPLQLLFSTPRGQFVFSSFFCMLTINAVLFNLPLYFQAVRLESATSAGGHLLIPSVAGTVGAVATGFIIDHTKRVSYTLHAGTFCLAIGSVLYCLLDHTSAEWQFLLILIPSNLGIGIFLPSAFLGLLGATVSTEQAVATSTLIMWRTLGSVLGVAISSSVVQNLLQSFLEVNVTGNEQERRHIINTVRSRVTAIFDLNELHQAEVIASYRSALQYAFLFTVVTAIIAALLVSLLRLPLLEEIEGPKTCDECETVDDETTGVEGLGQT